MSMSILSTWGEGEREIERDLESAKGVRKTHKDRKEKKSIKSKEIYFILIFLDRPMTHRVLGLVMKAKYEGIEVDQTQTLSPRIKEETSEREWEWNNFSWYIYFYGEIAYL